MAHRRAQLALWGVLGAVLALVAGLTAFVVRAT